MFKNSALGLHGDVVKVGAAAAAALDALPHRRIAHVHAVAQARPRLPRHVDPLPVRCAGLERELCVEVAQWPPDRFGAAALEESVAGQGDLLLDAANLQIEVALVALVEVVVGGAVRPQARLLVEGGEVLVGVGGVVGALDDVRH